MLILTMKFPKDCTSLLTQTPGLKELITKQPVSPCFLELQCTGQFLEANFSSLMIYNQDTLLLNWPLVAFVDSLARALRENE